jgi:hypothetical protein
MPISPTHITILLTTCKFAEKASNGPIPGWNLLPELVIAIHKAAQVPFSFLIIPGSLYFIVNS